MRSKNLVIRYINAMLDILAMLEAYIIANKIKFGWWRTGIRNEANSYMTLFAIFLAAYFIVLLMFFAYENMLERSATKEAFIVAKMLIYMTLLVTLYMYITKTNEFYSRGQMGYFLGLSYIFVYIERQWLKWYLTKSYNKSDATEKIMLVTTASCAETIIRKIKETKNWYFRITSIAIVDCDMRGKFVSELEVTASKENLVETIATSENDGVFLFLPTGTEFDYTSFINDIQEMGKQVHLNITEYSAAGGTREIQFLGKFPTVTWSNKNYRIRYKAIKRLLDVIIGILGVVLLAPMCLIASVGHWIENDSGHTIIGRVRVGRNGRRFYQYSFRVLRNDRNEISKTGRLLQKLGVRNLPRIWNVLWNDMSLVGVEAPSLPDFLNYTRNQRRGLSTKPGIIQFWPAYYWARKNDENITIERCEAEYVEHWSLWLDVKILIRTIALMFRNPSFFHYVRDYREEQQYEECKILGELTEDERALDLPLYRSSEKRVLFHAIKRGFDILLALAGMIIALPVLLIIAILVRIEDGQGVIYRQLRIGMNGEKIYIYKIRTMRSDAGDLKRILTPEQYEQYQREFKIENDPRVTKLGNILRKTSLDELPQLLNILKGDLSFVGPRPIVEKETKIYGDQLNHFLSVRPGLTGYWQAYARNNATYESGERQKMELYYVDNQSIRLDVKILFKTVQTVIKRDGAM